ncbi:MAG: hypothetical protein KGJ62_00995 [Armatimonadetes bacterium]|nr:hypothetical protein [Armatimonadota bacterium]MDE2207776.1 hypothetical protein [Armatimonadota bacterium]
MTTVARTSSAQTRGAAPTLVSSGWCRLADLPPAFPGAGNFGAAPIATASDGGSTSSGSAAPQSFSPVTNILSPAPTETISIVGDLGGNAGAPPDTEGAVGKSYILTGSNYMVVVTDRAGNLTYDANLLSFWESVTGDSFDKVTDPHFLYDPYSDRYIATAIANWNTANAMVLIAATQGDDPAQFWNGWAFRDDASGQTWYDYPSTGFNTSWVAIGLNAVPVGSSTFSKSVVWVFEKSSLYAVPRDGALAAQAFNVTPTTVGSPTPAVTYSSSQPDLYIAANTAAPTNRQDDQVQLYRVTGSGGGAALDYVASPTTSSFADWSGNHLPQSGGNDIAIFDDRVNSCCFRNGSIWLAQSVGEPAASPTQAGVQWWQLSTSGTVQQTGILQDPNGVVSYAYGGIAANVNNDVLLGYSSFSVDQFPSADYAFRAGGDAIDAFRLDRLFEGGRINYNVPDSEVPPLNRWGDFTTSVVDPVNDSDMWTIQEYSFYPSTMPWAVTWAKVVIDGAYPASGLAQGAPDVFYGTAVNGGSYTGGAVYSITSPGGVYTQIHAFSGPDGEDPYGTPLLIGNYLYGTAVNGGASGHGDVWRIDLTNQNPATNLTVLHSFDGADGAMPYCALAQDSGGVLYGTTYAGGTDGMGTAFKIDQDGTNFITIHNFSGYNHSFPANSEPANCYAGFLIDSSNNLWGASFSGGGNDAGELFEMNTAGTITSKLHSFGGADGANPYAPLIMSGSTLYGVTDSGGSSGKGVLFAVTTAGTYAPLHTFTGYLGPNNPASDGDKPLAGLLLSDGTLYGETYQGGYDNLGAIFSFDLSNSVYSQIHSFSGYDAINPGAGDGSSPYATLVADSNGLLFGTTAAGGGYGSGVVYSITNTGSVINYLYSFSY